MVVFKPFHCRFHPYSSQTITIPVNKYLKSLTMTQGRDTSEFNNLAVSTIIIEFDNAIINYII
jgi:hypothetical protein